MDARVEETSIEAANVGGLTRSSSQSGSVNNNNNKIASFDHDSSKYRCCCNCVHVKTGTKTIGFIELLCAVINLLRYLLSSTSYDYRWFFIGELIDFVILLVLIVCLFVAIHKQNPYLLLPYLIYQSLSIFASLTFIIFSIIALSDSDGQIADWYYYTVKESNTFKNVERNKLITYMSIASIIFYFLSICLQLWWNWVVFKCYVYLRDYRKFRNN